MISTEDYEWFVDRALDQMAAILRELGDSLAVIRPNLPGANSPYGIVTHCLGVANAWAGERVAGRQITRDRDAEFLATGAVDELIGRIDAARLQLNADVAVADMSAPLKLHRPDAHPEVPYELRQGAALFHVYEELAQHLGQLEITRDLLAASH